MFLCGTFPFNTGKLNKNEQDVPAVHDNRSCILGITRLHLLQEFQHPDGGEGDPKIGPAGEVELSHQALRLLVRDVANLKGKRVFRLMRNTRIFLSYPKSEGRDGAAAPRLAGWLKKD